MTEDLNLFIAEHLATTPPSAPLRALTALWEVHRPLHTCQSTEGHSGTYGGRDRPTCASLRLIASAWQDAPEVHPPIRVLADVHRLGPVGMKADALAYGSLHVQDTPALRIALEEWAESEGVSLTWREL